MPSYYAEERILADPSADPRHKAYGLGDYGVPISTGFGFNLDNYDGSGTSHDVVGDKLTLLELLSYA